MTERGKLFMMIGAIGAVLELGHGGAASLHAQAVFRASVNLIRVGAIVRDRRGRLVQNLTAKDFEILDDGKVQTLASFHSQQSDLSLALLVDVSGSMEGRMADARAAAGHVLASISPTSDEAAVFVFDTRLDEVTPFTTGLQQLPSKFADLEPFGATSLHDAIAATAERLTARGRLRRAVIVLTDGIDTASRLTAPQVSAIASAIDVPVYIIGVVPGIDNPGADRSTVAQRSPLAGSLADLATWTGGHAFVVSTPAERSSVARQIIGELRQQYVMSFESSGRPGWHPLVVRTRDKDLVVRARSGYNAGQSRPIS